NAYGLYNMAGNVSEWVLDTYRPTSPDDVNDFRPFRGNVYTAYETIEGENNLEEKDSLGRIPTRILTDEELLAKGRSRRGTLADLRNLQDGDSACVLTYRYGTITLSKHGARVHKGAAWAGRPYWRSRGPRGFRQA